MLLEFYRQTLTAHVTCVAASGALFAVRGAGVLTGARWPVCRWLRFGSYGIDTLLLIFGVLLVFITHQYPLVAAWLTVKLVLLVAYIALGSMALKRAPTRRTKGICYALALATFASIGAIAIAHDPLGPIALLTRWR